VTAEGLRLIALYDEPRLAALPVTRPLACRSEMSTLDLAEERHLKYLEPSPVSGTGLRSVEEKLEHVAAGHGIILLPRAATHYYTRPDIVYIPVPDADLDRVWLASPAGRRSPVEDDHRIHRRRAANDS
jgi:DNA-binding transcriptional LysR family regulator